MSKAVWQAKSTLGPVSAVSSLDGRVWKVQLQHGEGEGGAPVSYREFLGLLQVGVVVRMLSRLQLQVK